MKVLLCSIVKEQNKYLREWVEHYRKVGVSNIYLFDNNPEGGENINDVIGDYIDSGFVIVNTSIKNTYLVDSLQADIYNKCYIEQSRNYDWIAFYDTDEYLCLERDEDVNTWLEHNRYNKFQVIALNWKTYTDNNRFFDDENLTIDKYTDYIRDRRSKDSVRVKCIYRTGIEGLFGKICIHGNTGSVNMCNSLGEKISNNKFPYTIQNLRIAYLKHLKYRSVDGVCKKIKLFLEQNISHSQQILDEYIIVNRMNEHKLKFLIDNLGDSDLNLSKIYALYDKFHNPK